MIFLLKYLLFISALFDAMLAMHEVFGPKIDEKLHKIRSISNGVERPGYFVSKSRFPPLFDSSRTSRITMSWLSALHIS